MVTTKIKDLQRVIVERLEVPNGLTRNQYVVLRMNYMQQIVLNKKELKKSFDIYKDELRKVLSCRRKLNDAEERLVEVFDRLEKMS